VAERLNRHFVFDQTIGQFFTIFYGVLDMRGRVCRYVSTGHPPPIHVGSAGDVRVLESSGLPVGIFLPSESGYQPFEEREIELNPGDRLYIYSDGVIERRNGQSADFGLNNLNRVLVDSRDQSLEESLDSVFESVQLWGDGRPLADDLSMLALKVR
jgi:phosphoserine phosphatase RsbU/P